MEQVIYYNIHHHEAMGPLIVLYFFLSGLGAGAFLTAVGLQIFGSEKYEKIARTAAIAAPVMLIPGLLCLLLDLGKPLRFLNLFFYFNPSSVASWGVWIINIFLVISVLYAFSHVIGKAQRAKPLAYLGLVFALAVGFYSGLLLYQMHGYVLWHSALLPMLFLVSAIASGLAVVLLLSGSAEPDQTRVLSKVLAVVVGIDLVLALTEVLTLAVSSGEKAEIANVILSGGYGFLFIVVYIIAGLALPLFVLVQRQVTRNVQVGACVLVLVGTLAMRYVIVVGGQALPLS
ncbi:MAG: NrfD/PsrC family molybdoenzyme membrane anchor subunit [Sedimentisphaerales bacterium]